MPIYSYKCKDCGKEFDYLILSKKDYLVLSKKDKKGLKCQNCGEIYYGWSSELCPACQSNDVVRWTDEDSVREAENIQGDEDYKMLKDK